MRPNEQLIVLSPALRDCLLRHIPLGAKQNVVLALSSQKHHVTPLYHAVISRRSHEVRRRKARSAKVEPVPFSVLGDYQQVIAEDEWVEQDIP